MTDGWLIVIAILVAIFWCRDEDGSFRLDRILTVAVLILGAIMIWPIFRAWL